LFLTTVNKQCTFLWFLVGGALLGLRLIAAVMVLLGLGADAAVAADRPSALAAIAGAMSPPPSAGRTRVELALRNILSLHRPGQDGYATVWDGNKYVQCGLARGGGLRCEAAGALMQPSLARVLTPDKVKLLGELGWALDPHFGNYVQLFPAAETPDQVAVGIQGVLNVAYDVDVESVQVETNWVAHQACPPRNGPSQNLAGMINDAPSMAPTAVYACAYFDPAAVTRSPQTTADLIARYGPAVSAEIQRLRVNLNRRVHVSFDTGLAYMQCEPDTNPAAIYCEAESAESWPAISVILTSDHVARLHAAGYADPGRAPNYWKDYPLDQSKDTDIAAEILTLLHDVYGYAGATPLEIKTEKGGSPDARSL